VLYVSYFGQLGSPRAQSSSTWNTFLQECTTKAKKWREVKIRAGGVTEHGGLCNGNLSTTTFFESAIEHRNESSLPELFQAKGAIVVSDNLVALAGGVFKFLAVHDLDCATGVLDELLPLQNTSCQAHGRSIRP